jgi:hypothetical protein
MKKWICCILLLVVSLSGCSPYITSFKKAEGIDFPGYKRFRINYSVHDDAGNNITDEIMKSETDRWFMFAEVCDRTKVAFAEKGYEYIYDPTVSTDFMVDVCFSAFYSDKITEEEMMKQKPATFLVGRKEEEAKTHMVILSVLAYDPELESKDLVVLWEGRGALKDPEDNVRSASFPIMVELLLDFPTARRR